ncbi:MAG: hypothetical protein IJP65_00275 [Bacteroidales bacterium]|nr:hypothetical protein [Bacteroidales bacterium]
MVTEADVNRLMKMWKAQEFREQGVAPEVALRLAGIDSWPGMGGPHRLFSREEANIIFAKDDTVYKMAKREQTRIHRARKKEKVSMVFQIVLAIGMAIAVAHTWKLL